MGGIKKDRERARGREKQKQQHRERRTTLGVNGKKEEQGSVNACDENTEQTPAQTQ